MLGIDVAATPSACCCDDDAAVVTRVCVDCSKCLLSLPFLSMTYEHNAFVFSMVHNNASLRTTSEIRDCNQKR
jgi:hypothetical protein